VGVTFAQKHQPASIIDITTVRSFRSPTTTTFIDTSPPSTPPTQHYHLTTYRAESYNLVSTAPLRTTTTTPSIITRSGIGSIWQR
jgi:hypothetical protein